MPIYYSRTVLFVFYGDSQVTDFAQSGSHGVITTVMHRIGGFLAVYGDCLRAAIRAHDAYESYNAMSDSALAEIGLVREEIPAHVMNRYLASGS
jgi:hypothetical protein